MEKRDLIFDFYAYLFARKKFYRLNRILFRLSLRGMGIFNYKSDAASGEEYFLREHLRGVEKPVVFDVGANKGDYSSAILKANRDAEVFAFEPHPITFEDLSRRLSPLGAKVINAACGKLPGRMVLYDYLTGGSEHASLYKGVIEELHRQKAQEHTVDVIDLDTFVISRGIKRIHLLKIDTEGHELEVLSGAKRILKEQRIGAIQFEFNEMNLISRTFLRDFYTSLSEYRLHRMVRDGLVPLPEQAPALCELFAFQNIVALPRPLSQ